MSEARMEVAWTHTSAIMAQTLNMNRDPKKMEAVPLDFFNPFVRRDRQLRRGIPITADSIHALKVLVSEKE